MFLNNFVQATRSRLRASALAGATLFTLMGAGSAGAQVMLRVPGDSPGIPAYARADRPFVLHTDEWAAIIFYRTPGCVPVDSNLLDFVDASRAFGCALTISGFELWDNGPGIDGGPRHAISSGLAVPVWFVPWPQLQAALADDVLTITELGSLDPLEGTATTFHEILNPSVPPDTTGGAKVPHLTITASGFLPDGRSFQIEFNSVLKDKPLVNVRIAIR